MPNSRSQERGQSLPRTRLLALQDKPLVDAIAQPNLVVSIAYQGAVWLVTAPPTHINAADDPSAAGRKEERWMTYIGPAVPAIKEHLEALCRFNIDDVDIANAIPKSAAGLGIIPVETDASEHTSALHMSADVCRIAQQARRAT